MLLSDLRLQEMPTSALLAIRRAITEELHTRKKQRFIERKVTLAHQARSSFLPPVIIEDDLPRTCRAIPEKARTHDAGFSHRYLPALLAQDWRYLFPHAARDEKCFYVYAHIDPRKRQVNLPALRIKLPGIPFYIGKGSGQRAFDLKRNDGHRKILAEIRTVGFPDTIIPHILKDRLTELDALVLEAKLIYFFGSLYMMKTEKSQRIGCLINLADHIRPIFYGEIPFEPLAKKPE